MVALPEARRTMELENKVPKSYFSFLFPTSCQRSESRSLPPRCASPAVQPRVSQGGFGAVDRVNWYLESPTLCQLDIFPFPC